MHYIFSGVCLIFGISNRFLKESFLDSYLSSFVYGLSRQLGAVSSVLHKLCSILALLKELLPISKLVDSSILQLMKTMLDTLGVDNIQLLQLKAIAVVCSVCIKSWVLSDT